MQSSSPPFSSVVHCSCFCRLCLCQRLWVARTSRTAALTLCDRWLCAGATAQLSSGPRCHLQGRPSSSAPRSRPAAGLAHSAASQQCSFLEEPGVGLAAASAQLSFLHLLPRLQLSLLFSFTSERPSLPPAAASGPTAAPPPRAARVEANSCQVRGSHHVPAHSCSDCG